MRLRYGCIATLLAAAGCGGAQPATGGSITCPPGRTPLDGVCVSEAVADYVACVRAQGAQLGGEKSDQISAEAGAFGVKAGAAREVSESLSRSYQGSDETMLAIIDMCNQQMSIARAPAAQPAAGTEPSPPAAAEPSEPPGSATPLTDGTLVRGSSEKTYVIEAGKRRWIPNPDIFNAMGFDWNAVVSSSDAELANIPEGQPLATYPDGTLLKGTAPEIYLLESGKRRHVPDVNTFNAMGFNMGMVQQIADKELSAIPLGAELPKR